MEVTMEDRIGIHQELLNVHSILLDFNNGNSREFDRLMNQLKDPDILSHHLAAILRSFDTVLIQIDRRFQNTLLPALIDLKWCHKEDYVVDEFKTFITGLLAVHNYHLPHVLNKLVRLFIPQVPSVNADVEISSEKRKQDHIVFSHVHTVIQNIIKYVPNAMKSLTDSIKHAFPSWKRHIYEIGCFVFNVLKMISYAPDLSPSLLELLIDKIISIDSQIDHNELRSAIKPGGFDENSEPIVSGLLENICDVTAIDSVEFNSNSSLTSKLDLLFWLLINFIKSRCYNSNGKLDWTTTKLFFRQLLTIFDKKILPLDSLCQVQFFIFYVCSFHGDLALGFVDYLWKRAQNTSLGYNLRQTAIWYLTDFLGRAKYVSVTVLKSCIDLMARWCHDYIEEKQNKASNYQAHKVFYSVCQSVFFLCTYRHSELMENEINLSWCHTLGLQALVSSVHNPLQFSEPNFVKLFSVVAKTYELAYCSSILEDNRQNNGFLSSKSFSKDLDALELQVALKFPFEDFLLHLSLAEIIPLMRQYVEGDRIRESSILSARLVQDLPEKNICDENNDETMICNSLPKQDFLFRALSQFDTESNARIDEMDTLVFGDKSRVFC